MSLSVNAVQVLSLKTSPILQLLVSRPHGVERALNIEGQSEVESFHLTLARLDDAGIVLPSDLQFPPPPESIDLLDDVCFVDSGAKRSCYCEVSPASRVALRDYIKRWEVAGVSLTDDDRVFHVTVSNAGGGAVRASVGAVWEHPSTRLDSALKQPVLSSKFGEIEPGEDARAAAVQRFANSPLLKALNGDFKTLQAENYEETQADGSRVRKMRIF